MSHESGAGANDTMSHADASGQSGVTPTAMQSIPSTTLSVDTKVHEQATDSTIKGIPPSPSPTPSLPSATISSPLPAVGKPRSDSILQSTRPAPPSPASSRHSSQIFTHSPVLGPISSSSPSASPSGHTFRDRSSSNSSSRVGLGLGLAPSSAAGSGSGPGNPRRISSSSGANRLSIAESGSSTGGRRLSTLRHSMQVGDYENEQNISTPGGSSTPASGEPSSTTTPVNESIATTSIPENATLSTTTVSATDISKQSSALGTLSVPASTESATSVSPSGSAISQSQLLSPQSTALPPSGPPSPTPSTPKDKFKISIRDYGFPAHDERFLGLGQPAPAPQKQRWRFSEIGLGSSSSGSQSPKLGSDEKGKSDGGTGAEDEGKRGWGFGGFLGWKGFIKRRASSTSASRTSSAGEDVMVHDEPEDVTSDEGGSDDDDDGEVFHRDSHGGGQGGSMGDDDYFSDEGDIDDDDMEEGGHRHQARDESDLIGMYRAVYPFEAEGENEMSLEEGEVIELKGRGGGEGWVVAVRDGREGLVPESYLEKYEGGSSNEDLVGAGAHEQVAGLGGALNPGEGQGHSGGKGPGTQCPGGGDNLGQVSAHELQKQHQLENQGHGETDPAPHVSEAVSIATGDAVAELGHLPDSGEKKDMHDDKTKDNTIHEIEHHTDRGLVVGGDREVETTETNTKFSAAGQ